LPFFEINALGYSREKSVLVVGAGSIGRRHLENLTKLGLSRLAACDPHPERLEYVTSHFHAQGFPTLEEALQEFRPNIVLICTPPVHHVAQAMLAVQAGAHVFIEKPLSDRMDGIQELQQEAIRRGATLQVGYNLRFHPAIQKLKQLIEENAVGKILWAQVECGSYLPDWRPWQDYRKSYTARRELGGGILLDGSHEIDYIIWFFGAPSDVVCMAGRVSTLEVNVEDCATILLQFPTGMRADVHLDFIQRSYSRACTLIGENGKLQWDFLGNAIEIVRPGIPVETLKFDCDVNAMYLSELQNFLECAESRSHPRFELEEAILTLRVALAARRSAEEKSWVNLA
jgi:predicted dehydrogenase